MKVIRIRRTKRDERMRVNERDTQVAGYRQLYTLVSGWLYTEGRCLSLFVAVTLARLFAYITASQNLYAICGVSPDVRYFKQHNYKLIQLLATSNLCGQLSRSFASFVRSSIRFFFIFVSPSTLLACIKSTRVKVVKDQQNLAVKQSPDYVYYFGDCTSGDRISLWNSNSNCCFRTSGRRRSGR